PVGGRLREYRVGSALVPGGARPVARRMAERVDADATLDQAADAWSLVPMQIGAAAGRERHAVAAQEQLAFGHGRERGRELLARGVAAKEPFARVVRHQLEPPPGHAWGTRLDHQLALAVPRLAFADMAALERGRAVDDEDQARRGRQADFRGIVCEHVF